MGWNYGTGQTRKELIERLTRQWTDSKGGLHTCLAHTSAGNVLWAVWEDWSAFPPYQERIITCDLLKYSKQYDGWGYKGMCESMGPLYYTCPLKYLDMVPEVKCHSWREKVREYHAKGKGLKVGDTVEIVNSTITCAKITSLRPLLGIGSNGRLYRLPKSFLGKVIA